jgi:hypothetical protein
MLKEELGSGLGCDTLLAGVRMAILENRSTTTIHSHFHAWWRGDLTCSPSRWIPRAIGSRKRGVQSLFFNGWLGNGAGSAGSDILTNILSKLRPIEILL